MNTRCSSRLVTCEGCTAMVCYGCLITHPCFLEGVGGSIKEEKKKKEENEILSILIEDRIIPAPKCEICEIGYTKVCDFDGALEKVRLEMDPTRRAALYKSVCGSFERNRWCAWTKVVVHPPIINKKLNIGKSLLKNNKK